MVATYEDMSEMIRLGAYRQGSDPKVDLAIEYRDRIEEFLTQDMHERGDLASCYAGLDDLLEGSFDE